MTPEQADQLREPFPPDTVGKLPRVTCPQCSKSQSRVCSDHVKRKCDGCGNFISERHIHLDYVGHAAVTDRLLKVDPGWRLEPTKDERGIPIVVERDGEMVMWATLTIAGESKDCVGIVTKGSFELEKQLLSDAIRNGAMRFGVAVDLWSKEDLHAAEQEATEPPAPPEPVAPRSPDPLPETGPVSSKLAKHHILFVLGGDMQNASLAWNSEFGDVKEVDRSALEALLLRLRGDDPPVGGSKGSAPDAPGVADDGPAEGTSDARPERAASEEDAPGDAAQPGMTAAMNKKLHAQMRKLGVQGDARHPFVSKMLGREVTSLNEVTFEEGCRLIEELERDERESAA